MQICFRVFLVCSVLTLSLSKPSSELESSSARIVNGYAVNITDVPYQATLRRRLTSGWSHICGAVIINRIALVTAGHCVYSYTDQPANLRVVAGTSSRLTGGKAYDISKIYLHEQYDSSTLQNDIALVITSKRMSFSQSINPIPPAPRSFVLPAGTEALVSGFGSTSFEGSSSSELLAAKVNILSNEVCARAYLRIASISNEMICANATNPPRDACQGDSGGPLVAENFLVGIVSWGEGCADRVYPGVYTRVSEYTSWIYQKLEESY